MEKDDNEPRDPFRNLRSSLIRYRDVLKSKDSPEKMRRKIQDLANEIGTYPRDPLQIFFRATFCARMEEEDPNGFGNINNIWHEAIEAFILDINKEDEQDFLKELLIVALYRMYRNLNEWYEHLKIKDKDLTKLWEHKPFENDELIETLVNEKISDVPRSNTWLRIVLHDDGLLGHAEPNETKRRIFLKSFNEYYVLMKNEKGIYDRRINKTESPFVLHGESLDRFLSNELAYLCTDLLHQLESIFKDKEGHNYINEWIIFRKGEKSPKKEFIDYQKRTKMLVGFLKNIVDLHKNRNKSETFGRSDSFRFPLFDERGKLTDEGERFEIFLEVAYLHAVIACQKGDIDDLTEIFDKWPKEYQENQTRKNRSRLRTFSKKDILDELVGVNPSLDLSQFLHGKKDGMSYAMLVRWLCGKSPGFYLALASNLCPGTIVGEAKLERNPRSSLWGNKVILKDGTDYHQVAQNIPEDYWKEIGDKLSEANRYFFSSEQSEWIGKVVGERLMFGATKYTFKNIEGASLQSEWESTFHPIFDKGIDDKNPNQERLVRLICDFATRRMGETLQDGEIKNLPVQYLEEESLDELRKLFEIRDDEPINCRVLDWVHGDEWGGNFTVKNQLYAIDLEDVLHKNDGDSGEIIVGGLHAWRFVDKSQDLSNITYDYNKPLSVEVFSPYAAIGRLFAALVQKSVITHGKTYGIKPIFNKGNRKKYIEGSIRVIWDVLFELKSDFELLAVEKMRFQVWASFIDWLAYWKGKGAQKLLETDYKTAKDHVIRLATEQSTKHESNPE